MSVCVDVCICYNPNLIYSHIKFHTFAAVQLDHPSKQSDPMLRQSRANIADGSPTLKQN